MLTMNPVADSDRFEWERLARDFHAYFSTEIGDEAYERTWRRLLDGEHVRGITARVDGKLVGIAHYLFHPGIWKANSLRCYLADLFVDRGARRRGVAAAMIEWVARDAEQHGAPRLYWNTTQDNVSARALYDKVADFRGHIVYNYRH